MSVDKKDKKDENSFAVHSNHLNRDERYRPVSPNHAHMKMEFNNSREKSPDKDYKEPAHNRENSQSHLYYQKDQSYTSHAGDRYYGLPVHSNHHIAPSSGNIDHSNNPYRLPPHPPLHSRQYPHKEYYPRGYNEYQKDFVINKKKEDLNLSDAMSFLETVKVAFSLDLSVYDSFLEVMRDYKHGKLDAGGVVRAATSLFKNKPELLEGFNDFLPVEYKIERNYRRRVRIDPPIRPHDRIGERYPHGGERVIERPERIPERLPERQHHIDRIVHKEMSKPLESKQFVSNNQNNMYENAQINEQLLALNFIKKVKIKLKNTGNYRQFIDLLTSFQKTQDNYVMTKMHKILSDHPELHEEFYTFVPKRDDSVISDIKKILEEKNIYEEFLKALNLFNQKLMNARDLVFLLRAYIKDEKMIESFKKHLGEENPELYNKEKTENERKESSKRKNLGEMMGSYRICTNKMFKSNQDAIAKQVLNNVCYSFPLYASEGGEDVQIRKSAYMDTLYRLEDERYELELLIERAESLAESFEIYVDRISDHADDVSEEEFDLSTLEMSAPLVNEIIVTVYGSEGNEIFEELINKPKVAIPVIFKRIYKLIKSWKIELREKEKVWKEATDKAFYKSLDYHLDFKALDKKYLNHKNFLKQLECDLDISNFKNVKKDTIELILVKYDKETIMDLLEFSNGVVSAELAARIKYFYLLVERISEIMKLPFYNDIKEMITQHLINPVSDFEDKLRTVSKSQAYKLSSVERLIDKICKKEIISEDTFEVCIDENLVIKQMNSSEKIDKSAIDINADLSLVSHRPFLKRTCKYDQKSHSSFKIVLQLKNNNKKIRYSEDGIDFVFKKGLSRSLKAEGFE